jgi:hypothetical protein
MKKQDIEAGTDIAYWQASPPEAASHRHRETGTVAIVFGCGSCYSVLEKGYGPSCIVPFSAVIEIL